ncbi:MAG TPA: hypothetical protein PLH83_07990 [Ruminococcus sp.]|nr:hypothetical protein [Ruminococcus sp.]
MDKKPFVPDREEVAGSMIVWLVFVAIFGGALVYVAHKHAITIAQALHSLLFEEGIGGPVMAAVLVIIPFYILINSGLYKLKKRRFISEGTQLECDVTGVLKRPKRPDRLEIRLPDGRELLSAATFENYDTFHLNKCTVFELNGEYIVTELYHKRSF